MIELNQILHGDCLEVMKDIDDKSIDLIIADIPYNISVAKWDKWKTVSAYVEYIGGVFKEYERVLKDNGSFYFFHNDFMQVVELQNWINKNLKFVFKQLIVWNKKFKGSINEGFLQGFNSVNNLRNYQTMAEYILYYTFQDETGLTTVMLDTNNFPTLRGYFRELLNYIDKPKKEIIESIGQKADHCFRWGSTQWDLPTQETYNELIKVFSIDKYEGFREYESLRQEYESLRQEYESLRYVFNNQKTHHSVWNYSIAASENHCTTKPVDLIENIIRHSSNEGGIVLDSFSGSGTTAVACINTNRNYICIEKDKDYFDASIKRIEKESIKLKLAI